MRQLAVFWGFWVENGGHTRYNELILTWNNDTQEETSMGSSDFVIENGVLKKYKGPGGDVTIPEGVTSIGTRAFDFCSSLASVTIPWSVTSIGDEAFDGCGSLASVTIPGSVTSIGTRAFWGCKSLANVTIPEGVTSIGDWAFCWCESLIAVSIPKSVTIIGDGAFSHCERLKSISVPNPDCVIGGMAFSSSGLEEAHVPVCKRPGGWMPGGVFSSCTKLKYVNFTTEAGGSLVITEKRTFENSSPIAIFAPFCHIESLCSYKQLAAVGYAIMVMRGEKVHAEIASGYEKYIRARRKALYTTALRVDPLMQFMIIRKIIPSDDLDALISSCEKAEMKAALLEYKNQLPTPAIKKEKDEWELGLPDASITIGEAKKLWAFDYVNGEITLTGYKGKNTEIVIPDKIGDTPVTGISRSTFSEFNTQITSVSIPDSVRNIESGTFRYCTNLADDNGLIIVNNILFRCFKYMRDSERDKEGAIMIPEGVTAIDDEAFLGCSHLTEITVPASVQTVGHRAFQGCEKLADINGFVIVRNTIFDYYGAGGTVCIPDGVTAIDDQAFANCPAIQKIEIPDSVTTIGRRAFYASTGLADRNGMVIVRGILFRYCGKAKQVVIPEGVTEIGDMAFLNCKSLESISVPDGVVRIGDSAFEGCKKLRSILLPETVERIGKSAFEDDAALRQVTLPRKLLQLEANTFKGCRSLFDMTLPDGLLSIGDEAFRKVQLRIVIPDSVQTIGANAFSTPNTTIIASAGSVAAKYASNHAVFFYEKQTLQ